MQKEIFKRQGLKEIPDQGTEGSCTAFAMCNIINGFKEPKYKKLWLEWEALDGHEYFNLVNSVYPPELQGSLAPSQAVIYAKNNWFIKYYEQLFIKNMNPLKFKKLLDAGFLFLIVVNKCDWEKTKKTFIATKKEQGGVNHSLALVDYDDKKECFKIVNSWGEEWGDKGYFYMKYEDLNYFVDQIYVILDSDDTENFNRLLYKARILSVVNSLSENWKYWNDNDKKAMNFAATMLRKIVLEQDHQYNMNKNDAIDFINKYL